MLQFWLDPDTFISNQFSLASDEKIYWGFGLNRVMFDNVNIGGINANFYIGAGINVRRILHSDGYPASKRALDPTLSLGMYLS